MGRSFLMVCLRPRLARLILPLTRFELPGAYRLFKKLVGNDPRVLTQYLITTHSLYIDTLRVSLPIVLWYVRQCAETGLPGHDFQL